jgi:hypothetical protein
MLAKYTNLWFLLNVVVYLTNEFFFKIIRKCGR